MVCPLYRECPLLRDSNCIILIGRLKFEDLVLSIIERYLIQCPLFGVSVKRDSTVEVKLINNLGNSRDFQHGLAGTSGSTNVVETRSPVHVRVAETSKPVSINN